MIRAARPRPAVIFTALAFGASLAACSGSARPSIPSPYSGAPTATISSGISFPYVIRLAGAGNLFVANYFANSITEYAPPYTGAPIATISNGVSGPSLLAFPPAIYGSRIIRLPIAPSVFLQPPVESLSPVRFKQRP